MDRSSISKLLVITAMVASFVPDVGAREGWVTTQTKAHPTDGAAIGLELRSGDAVDIAVSLQMRNKADLDVLTRKIASGERPALLTPEQFMSRHAPSAVQVQAVVDHLRLNGFVNVQVAENRMLVTAQGSAGSVKKAFRTALREVRMNGRSAFANDTDVMVPAHLAGVITAVHGLQNVHRFHTAIAPADVHIHAATGHNPTEFPKIYNANGLVKATKTTIGIISQGDLTQTLVDLNAFATGAGYGLPSTSVVVVGAASTDTSGLLEWNMDSQASLATAGGKVKQMIFYAANSLTNANILAAVNKAVTANKAQVINVSLGECETGAQSSGLTASMDAVLQVAVAQGQTFSVSTGDSGSYECGGKTLNRQSYPAVSPYVIAVGGTTLKTTAKGGWSDESVWKGAGGGPSVTEAAPAWQLTSGVMGAATSRGVPDISFDANPSTGALVLLNGSLVQVGGTSLSAPIFAGFWARMQSAYSNGLVFPAATLYQFGPGNPGLFHDVTVGDNGGFTAAAGWDYASGFGSLDMTAFSNFVATHAGF
jgi:pseudomonalisin/xanthomonalisin